MKRFVIIALTASLALSACAGSGGIDVCKYSAERRAVYRTAIAAADTYAASGKIVPYELAMGRLAATTALAVLDTNCPAPT